MNYIVTNRHHEEFFKGTKNECQEWIMSNEPDPYSDEYVPPKFTLPDLPEVDYPCGTTAYYDEEEDAYFNAFGQRLRDPREYDRRSEGYTPFGDEGDDY